METLALAERLVRLAPDFVESWSELSWIYAELGREEESLAVLQQFLSDHPANAEAYASIAWRCNYLRRPEERAVYARRAYELAPQNFHVCWTLIVACHPPTNAISEADGFRFVAEIAARFSQDAFLLEIISYFYATRNRLQEAKMFASKALALQPDNPALQRLPAAIYRLCGRWQEAAQEYRRLVELPGGRNISLLAWLGEALTGLQNPEAEATFTEAEERVQSLEDYLTLIDVYEHCGRYDRAVAAVHKILSSPLLPALKRKMVEMQLQRIQTSAAHP
jgi:tetratricopeptide (TPR) repeat protein